MALTNYVSITNKYDNLIINDSYENLCLSEVFRCTDINPTLFKNDERAGAITTRKNRQFYRFKNVPDRAAQIVIDAELENLIFVSDLPEGVFVSSYRIGSLWHFEFGTGDASNTYISDKALKSISFYVYGKPHSSSADKVGLQIFNEKGNTIFDSRLSYLNVLDYVTMSLPYPNKNFPYLDDGFVRSVKAKSKNYGQNVMICPIEHLETVFAVSSDQLEDNFFWHHSLLNCRGSRVNTDYITLDVMREDSIQYSDYVELRGLNLGYLVAAKPKLQMW